MIEIKITSVDHQLEALKNAHAAVNYTNDGLIAGTLGGILLDFTLGKTYNDSFFYDRGTDRLNDVITRLLEQSVSGLNGYSLANGLIGLLFVIELLEKESLLEEDIEIPREVKTAIYDWCIQKIAVSDTDFLHGAMGAIHYFSFNAKSGSDTQKLQVLVKKLLEQVTKSESQDMFFLNISGPIPEERPAIKTGIAHGQTGIYLVLINVYRLGILQDEIRTVIVNGINLLITYLKTDNSAESLFPRVIFPNGSAEYTPKLAWCFGDLNVVYLLYEAGALFNNQEWELLAEELGGLIAKKTCYEESSEQFPLFCHGTAGVSYIYDKLFKLTGNSGYLMERNRWLKKTIELTDKYGIDNIPPALLNGYVGLGLVYCDLIQNGPPFWAELFLI